MHLFFKGVFFARDTQGKWIISKIETNMGTFAMGEIENSRLDSETVQSFMSYLSFTFKEDLEQFLQEESKDSSDVKPKQVSSLS